MGRRLHSERDADISSCLVAGMATAEISVRIGWPVWKVYGVMRRLRLPRVDQRTCRQTTNDPRAPVMASLYQEGQTLQQIGDRYGISRERVRQILRKRTTVTADQGGSKLMARRRRVERATKRDCAYMERLGCGWEEYRRIRQVGAEKMRAGVSRYRTPMGAFINQRNNAHKREVGWELTFWQWWSVWQASGQWDRRGRESGQYVMCRIGDVGPYALGNIYIATCNHNCSSRRPRSSQSEMRAAA